MNAISPVLSKTCWLNLESKVKLFEVDVVLFLWVTCMLFSSPIV